MSRAAQAQRMQARAWLIWAAAVAGYILAITSRSSLAATGVVASERFEIPASVLSVLSVVQVITYAAMQIPVGVLIDRWGPRRLMAVGAFLMGAGHFAMALADGPTWAIVARAVVGMGDAMTFVSVLRLLPSWFPPRTAPVLVQVTGMLGMLGQLISVVPFAAAVITWGWETAFIGFAGISIFAAATLYLVIRDAPTSNPHERAASLGHAARGMLLAWKTPGTRLGFWTHFSTPFAATVFSLLWGYPFLTTGEGLSAPEASLVMLSLVVANLVSGPIIGALTAARPRWRVGMVIILISAQALALSVVLAWPGPAPLTVLIGFAAVIAVGGPASMIAFDFARTTNPLSHLGSANGIVNIGGFAAAGLVLAGVGILLDAQGAAIPSTYSLESFRIAMLAHYPIWALGLFNVFRLRSGARTRSSHQIPKPTESLPRRTA